MTLLIRERDCYYDMYLELRAQARTLNPLDSDRRVAWFDACRDLLAQVPDEAQRAAWSYLLAEDFVSRLPGTPHALILGWLMQGHP